MIYRPLPLLSLALLLAASLVGCNADQPGLVSAVFLDGDSPDGVVSQGEAIVLTFSEPVNLEGRGQSGVRLLPAGHALGFYEVLSGSEFDPPRGTSLNLTSRHLVVVIEGGERKVVASGRHGRDPDATGIVIDFDALSIVTRDGRRLTGQSEPVDLASHEYDPAALVSAEWIDSDGSSSVSRGDEVRLTWDRPVQIGDTVKQQRNAVPADLFVLPVEGDRIATERGPARLEQRTEDRSLYVVLGESPRLSPSGEYDATHHEIGSSTGIAVRGTPIRRNVAILDALSRGVADAVAIDLRGGLDLFTPEPVPIGLRSPMAGHTATPLPGGRVLVAGGMLSDTTEDVLGSAYLFDLETREWSAPIRMREPRRGHSATYFAGADGREGSADDFVVIAGGRDEFNEILHSLEIIFPFVDRPEFELLITSGATLPRAQHTAHLVEPELFIRGEGDLPALGHLVLVGGYLDGGTLNGVIDVVELYDGANGLVTARSRPLETLAYPRAHHDSIVVDQPTGPVLFVYGGRGDESRHGEHVNAVRSTCSVLAAPELFTLDNLGGQLTATRRRLPSTTSAGPRWEHRLVPLLEERANVLLVGGSTEETPRTDDELATAYRLDIDVERDPIVEFQRTGKMLAPRSEAAAAVLPSGRVLIIGGIADGRPTRWVEVFDPHSNEFEVYGSRLLTPRSNHTVTPLSEEEWLILGGAPGGELYRWPEW